MASFDFTSIKHFRIINLDKLALGASADNVTFNIQESDRYQFIHGSLLDQKLVQNILSDHQVS